MKVSEKWIKHLPFSEIQNLQSVQGGMANQSYLICSGSNKYFMKVQPKKGEDYFKHQVESLKLINQIVPVPDVVDYGQINHDGYLILNWQNFGSGSQYDLGKAVAHMHQIHMDAFGLDHDFKGGKIPKYNDWKTSWVDFYTKQRLDPLVDQAKSEHKWNQFREEHYQNLRNQFIDYYSNHQVIPSLLHGDLWKGNCKFTENGEPMLIDPNSYFGDREVDLATSTVSSGFSEDFYQGYDDTYPVRPGFRQRMLWYRFYYLLIHLIWFGGVYNEKVDNVLQLF